MIPKYVKNNPTLLARYHYDKRYRELVDQFSVRKKPLALCAYLGEQIGERYCEACGDRKVTLKVYACSHPEHVETTLAECRNCPHNTPSE